MTTVDLSDLQNAVDWVSATDVENRAFICRRSGTIYWLSDEYGLDEADIGHSEDLDDPEKYLPVLDKYELDIGNRLVFDFVASNLPDQYDRVRDVFRRKGAYRAFKVSGMLQFPESRRSGGRCWGKLPYADNVSS